MARSCANRRNGVAEATRIRSNKDCDILVSTDVGVGVLQQSSKN